MRTGQKEDHNFPAPFCALFPSQGALGRGQVVKGPGNGHGRRYTRWEGSPPPSGRSVSPKASGGLGGVIGATLGTWGELQGTGQGTRSGVGRGNLTGKPPSFRPAKPQGWRQQGYRARVTLTL